MPSKTIDIPFKGKLHAKVLKRLDARIRYANRSLSDREDAWNKADDTILAYVNEGDLDKKRRVKRESLGEPKYTTIKLPYTYALLMTAHTYLTSVFFGRNPIHQFSGRHGETEQQVQGLEAVIAYQVEVGELLGHYFDLRQNLPQRCYALYHLI